MKHVIYVISGRWCYQKSLRNLWLGCQRWNRHVLLHGYFLCPWIQSHQKNLYQIWSNGQCWEKIHQIWWGILLHFFKKYSKSKKNLAAKSFFLKFWKVVKLVQEALKEPEHTGSYDEYIELCKLYDKNENGTMMLAELENFLSNLGKCFTFNIPCIWRTSDIPKLILGVIL